MLGELCGLAASWVTWQAVLVGVAVFLSIIYMTRKRYRLPPGPTPLPLAGNILGLWGKRFHEQLYAWSKKYGPVMTVYLGPVRCVVVHSLDTALDVLIHQGAEFAGRLAPHSMLLISEGGKDIVAGDYGPVWKLQRRLGLSALKKYMSGVRLEEKVADALEEVRNEFLAQEMPFNPYESISFLIHRVLHAILFGKKRDAKDPDFLRFMKILEGFEQVGSGVLEDIFPPLRLCPTPTFRRLMAADRDLNDLINCYVQEHKDRLDPNDIRDVTDALLFALREEGEFQELSDPVYVRQILKDLFVAGMDTSRRTLTSCIFFMAVLPDVQRRVQEELDRELGSRRCPRLEDKARLPYTEATLHESMRLGSVVPLGVPHKALKDSTIGDYEVPADTLVLINHWALHNDQAYWDSPQDFRPERFLCQEGKMAGKPAAWLPFSAGRRVCLGETVARPELLLLLAGLLRNFSFAFPPGEQHHVLERQGEGFFNGVPPFRVVATPRE